MEHKEKDEILLRLENLKTVISSKDGKLVPVDGVDIEIPKGKTVGVVGESGCGKSMTAMSIMGLLPSNTRVEEGKILLGETDLTKLSPKELRKITGDKISIIFQEPMTSLNPVIQVGKQVREAILLHEKISKEEAKQRVIEIFKQVGIPEPERRYRAYPHQLSGGLRQRVMIGMAMVCNPDLLIADEPTTALDVTIEAQILHLMRQLQKQKGTSIMMITHNLGVVAELCDKVYVMYAGYPVGTPIPTTITVYKDKSFTFETKQPPVTFLIMQETGIKKGSSSTGKGFIGKITMKQIENIAKKKMVDMNADTLEAAMKMIEGSAISMGFEIVE